MPRLSRKLPKYRLHRARNQAIVSIDGRRIYLGPYDSPASRQKYDELIAEWLDSRLPDPEPEKPKPPSARDLRDRRGRGGRVKLVELAAVYRKHADGYYVKHGERTREAELIQEVLVLLDERFPKLVADDFTPVDLEDFREWLIDEKDWSRKYLNKQAGRVVRMFKWAAAKQLADVSTYQELASLSGLKKGRTGARETPPVQPVPDAVIDATLAYLSSVVGDMVRFQRLTAARPGEVCQIRPCDVDRSDKPWQYRPASHKTEHCDRDRVIYVGPQAQAVLRKYLLRGSEDFCFSPREAVAEMRAKRYAKRGTAEGQGNSAGTNRKVVPLRRPGVRYSVETYRLAVQRACVKNGIPKWAPNQLRHNAATRIRRDYGIEAVQVTLGHSSAEVSQVYAERNMALAARIATEVG